MRTRLAVIAPAAALAIAATLSLDARTPQPATAPGTAIDSLIAKAYTWRSIGPLRGGRSIAVSGVKGRAKEAYFGAVGGGLWKTTDGGDNWAPVTDGQIGSSSVGAVAVSESNPDVVYIGTGESCIRGNIMPGDGVYKSTDAGKTWTKVGFAGSDAISKIRIHPTNPDVVFVADFGKYSVPSEERGVFKTSDGGKTWRKVLYRDNKTGAVDIAIDRRNPAVVYAALWEAYRIEYQMSSGGPGSGLFKSTDGGEHWTEITRSKGLPSGVVGRIGIAVSGADSNRVYALVENENGGLFSSDDGGTTWALVNANRNIRQRAFYYTHIAADPQNKDTVYALNTSAFRSTDGGKTLVNVGGGTHGDHHDLWIDPDDPKHLVIGNDGGGAVSTDGGGQAWTAQDFATGQFYHVISTRHVPYDVCGAQQDNTTLCVASNTTFGRGGGGGGRGQVHEPYQAGGGEPGYIATDPRDPDVFYAGANNGSFITQLNRRNGNLREVSPYPRMFQGEPSSAVVERWQWTFPIIFSYVDPSILYATSQHVWMTKDGGTTWTKISGDLTRHDPKTMGPSGGPITKDMNSPEIYATVFSLAPGKKNVDVIWAGSDDGLIQVTRDGGKTWTNVTPKEMPDLGRVSQIDGSSFDDGTAYVAVKKPLLNDYQPYLFRTHDFGRTWTKITTGIADGDYTHVIREDPVRKGLLYAGTQHNFYVSFDDGDHWTVFNQGLPNTQVSDIWVEANSLAIATHGRGFYVLDDLAPLRQAGAEGTANAYLFKPGDAVRSGGPAQLDYLLKQAAQNLTIEVLDAKGAVVNTIKGAPPAQGRGGRGGGAAPEGGEEGGGGRGRGVVTASLQPGLNRVAWNLDYAPASSFPGMILWGGGVNGPMALPGNYQVKLTVDGQSQTQPLVIRKNPLRADVSDADLQAQFDTAIQIRDTLAEANNAVIQIRQVKDAVQDRLKKANKPELKLVGDRLVAALSSVEEAIYQVRNQSGQDPLNFPIKINNRLATLLSMVERGDGRPTGNVMPIYQDLKKELKAETDRLDKVYATELKSFNIEATNAHLEPVSVGKQ